MKKQLRFAAIALASGVSDGVVTLVAYPTIRHVSWLYHREKFYDAVTEIASCNDCYLPHNESERTLSLTGYVPRNNSERALGLTSYDNNWLREHLCKLHFKVVTKAKKHN